MGRFDKMSLLMFAEYQPLLEALDFVENLAPEASSHFHHGEEALTFPFEHAGSTWRLGPMICYEDTLPDHGRRLAVHHPHLLVNLTNDAWFGDTSEPWEHLALSVFRAVEMRTDLVRAVNAGVSAFIDVNGRVYHRSHALDAGPGVDAVLAETVLMGGVEGGGHSFYARFGDVFGTLNVLVLSGLWLVWPRVRRHSRVSTSRRAGRTPTQLCAVVSSQPWREADRVV